MAKPNGKQPSKSRVRKQRKTETVPQRRFSLVDFQQGRNTLGHSLLLLYALLFMLAGSVIPIADALASHEHSAHKPYLEIFSMMQQCLSIIGLIYLDTLMYVLNRKKKKMMEDKQQSDDLENFPEGMRVRQDDQLQLLVTESAGTPEAQKKVSKFELPAEELEGEDEKEAETVFSGDGDGDTAAAVLHYDRNSAFRRKKTSLKNNDSFSKKSPVVTFGVEESNDTRLSLSNTLEDEPDKISMSESGSSFPSMRREDSSASQLSHRSGDSWCRVDEGEEPFFNELTNDSEGVNLYLRLGAVAFGFGVMVHDGFKIADQWEEIGTWECRGMLWIPKHMSHLIWVMVQTFFLFKNHKIIFNIQKPIVRLIMIHLVVANLSMWMKTVVFEVKEDLVEDMEFEAPENMTKEEAFKYMAQHNITKPFRCTSFTDKLSSFLFPCAIEWSLISAAIFFRIFDVVGKVLQHKIMKNQKVKLVNHKIHTPNDCHKSHKGFFFGLVMIMVTMVSVTLFHIHYAKHQYTAAHTVAVITDLFLTTVGVILSAAAIRKILMLHGASHIQKEERMDISLLCISMVGITAYNMFTFIAGVESILVEMDLIVLGYCIRSGLEILQCGLQMILIIEASRRYAQSASHLKSKPGRATVMALLVGNLAMWIINTFETKKISKLDFKKDYYGVLPWSIIFHVFLPLIIFFRFHSTVCLSNIWAKCYKDRCAAV